MRMVKAEDQTQDMRDFFFILLKRIIKKHCSDAKDVFSKLQRETDEDIKGCRVQIRI